MRKKKTKNLYQQIKKKIGGKLIGTKFNRKRRPSDKTKKRISEVSKMLGIGKYDPYKKTPRQIEYEESLK